MNPEELSFDSRGLIPGIVQDAHTGRVLMLGYLSRRAVEETLQSGLVHFWSRSRQELWRKGATSGNALELVEMETDCDRDALLIRTRPTGPVCHRGTESCFDPVGAHGDAPSPGDDLSFLTDLWAIIADRARTRPEGSYTASLLEAGLDAIGAKVLEEAGEVVEAAREEGLDRVAEEAADLLYHLFVLLADRDVTPTAVVEVLRERHP